MRFFVVVFLGLTAPVARAAECADPAKFFVPAPQSFDFNTCDPPIPTGLHYAGHAAVCTYKCIDHDVMEQSCLYYEGQSLTNNDRVCCPVPTTIEVTPSALYLPPCNPDVPDCDIEICGNGLDDDCDGVADEVSDVYNEACVDEHPCNGKDDNNDGEKDEGAPLQTCSSCNEIGRPVHLRSRQMYVRPRQVAHLQTGLGADHDLLFTITYDSHIAQFDFKDEIDPETFAPSEKAQLPNLRSLGVGFRHNWDHRLILDDPTDPGVITWLHADGSARFFRDGSAEKFRSEPGSQHRLVKVPSTSPTEWRLLTEDGDLMRFQSTQTSPTPNGTQLHPWGVKDAHARLRAVHPKSLAGYRFVLHYEDDVGFSGIDALPSASGACDQIVGTTTACVATRGLLARVGIQWLATASVGYEGPSLELKYLARTTAKAGGEFVLDRLLPGVERAEGKTTAQMSVLAKLSYIGTSPAQLDRVSDGRRETSDLAVKVAYSWQSTSGLDRWALTEVKEPVLDASGAAAFALSESFTWVATPSLEDESWRRVVAVHKSPGLEVEAQSDPGSALMTWKRNGTLEDSTFDPQTGDIIDCGTDQCGVDEREYATAFSDYYNVGPKFIRTEEGTNLHRIYDNLNRLIVICDVKVSGTSTCEFTPGGALDSVTSTGGFMRRAERIYYVGDTGVVRARAEWLRATNGHAKFPAAGSTAVNWFSTQTTALTGCPMLDNSVDDDGTVYPYRVTVFDHDSDADGTLNELPAAGTLAGDFAVTRATTVGTVDGLSVVGTCTVHGIDRYGRHDRGAAEVRFDLRSDFGLSWAMVEDSVRGYKAIPSGSPRRTALPSSHSLKKTAGVASSESIVQWKQCAVGETFDEEGRFFCVEVPHGTDFLRVKETTSTDTIHAGATRRVWAFTDALGGILLRQHRIETGGQRLLRTGVGDPDVSSSIGNRVEVRYATGDARVGPAVVKRTELRADGAAFATTTNAHLKGHSGVTGGYLLSSTTTTGGSVTMNRRYSDYDVDGRPAQITDELGSVDALTQLTYTDYDAIATIAEPDGQTESRGYAAAIGEISSISRSGPSTALQVNQRRTYDRRGRLQQILNPSSQTTVAYTYDGLDRVEKENLISVAGIQRSYQYDDVDRVRVVTTVPLNGASRIERRLYDGLGRQIESCDKSNLFSPLSADCTSPSILKYLFVYDTKGVFATTPTTCGAGGITLTDRYMKGRLGYVTDDDGATAYEYDALGRVLAVARHDGPLGSYSPANVTCTVYEYNEFGAVSSIKYPSLRTVVYGYGTDKARPSSVTANVASMSVQTLIADNIQYEPNGQIRSLRWNGSSTSQRTVVRDPMLRVTAITDSYSGVLKSSISYAYDLDGDLTSETDSIAPTMLATGAATAPVTRTADDEDSRDILGRFNSDDVRTYDAEGRQVGWQLSLSDAPAPVTYSSSRRELVSSDSLSYYFYDLFGQLTTADFISTSYVDKTLVHGTFGEVTSVDVYGNGLWSYRYDHEMRRVRKIPPSTADANYRWRFRYGLGRQILEDFTRSTSTAFKRTEWIYLAGEPLAIVYSTNTNAGTLFHTHNDRMGVARKLTSTTGSSVARLDLQAFGGGLTHNDVSNAPAFNTRYAGQYYDNESQLLNNGYRTLIPGVVGFYSSPDPLHMRTQMSHLGPAVYAYAANRPFVYQDPDGRYFESAIDFAAIGIGVAAIQENVAAGYYGAAFVDFAGIIIDGAMLAVPVGTVGAGIWINLIRRGGDEVCAVATKVVAQDLSMLKRLSKSEAKSLEAAGHHPHEIKEGFGKMSLFDLFKDAAGNVFVGRKDGIGFGDPTNLNLNRLE